MWPCQTSYPPSEQPADVSSYLSDNLYLPSRTNTDSANDMSFSPLSPALSLPLSVFPAFEYQALPQSLNFQQSFDSPSFQEPPRGPITPHDGSFGYNKPSWFSPHAEPLNNFGHAGTVEAHALVRMSSALDLSTTLEPYPTPSNRGFLNDAPDEFDTAFDAFSTPSTTRRSTSFFQTSPGTSFTSCSPFSLPSSMHASDQGFPVAQTPYNTWPPISQLPKHAGSGSLYGFSKSPSFMRQPYCLTDSVLTTEPESITYTSAVPAATGWYAGQEQGAGGALTGSGQIFPTWGATAEPPGGIPPNPNTPTTNDEINLFLLLAGAPEKRVTRPEQREADRQRKRRARKSSPPPAPCHLCGKGYSRKDGLERHVRSAHAGE